MNSIPEHLQSACNAIAEIFPVHKNIQHQGGMVFEINGVGELGNCNIILSVADGFDNDRTHFLVQTPTHTVYFRICDAAEDSDYAKFAIVHSFVENTNLDIGDYVDKVTQRMKYLGSFTGTNPKMWLRMPLKCDLK